MSPVTAAPDEGEVLRDTRRWLERAVIGLNLCPFAKAVHQRQQIRWVVSPARSRHALAEHLALEALNLARAEPALVDTTLLIHPRVLTRFADYLDFLPLADDVLRSLGLDGVLQVASFHPRYRFAELPPRDAGHRCNRSPYPMLHLLREDSVTRAVAAFPQASRIYEHNISTLRELGTDGWRDLLAPNGKKGQRRHR